MKKISLLTTFTLLSILTPCFADTIHVPGDQPSIQAGIDAAVNGDIVLVAPGTYIENINFSGKAIEVKSSGGAASTLIDGESPVDPDKASVVTFNNGEGLDSVLDGFTLCHGIGSRLGSPYYEMVGGGIYCTSSPTIRNNIIKDNSVSERGHGGGISCKGSPLITGNTITSNTASFTGGGIYCDNDSSPTIHTNVITENILTNVGLDMRGGGGISCYSCEPIILENTITGNMADGSQSTGSANGGGILCDGCHPVITGNIISGNTTIENSGGGIFILGGGTQPTVISGNVITENVAEGTQLGGWGGGIQCDQDNVTISSNLIMANRAKGSNVSEGGGGILCSLCRNTVIENNIIIGNSAEAPGDLGGGINYWLSGTSPNPGVVRNNLIMNNSAPIGGGLSVTGGEFTVSNNLISGNSATSGGGICAYYGTFNLSNNTIYNNEADTLGGGVFCSHDSFTDISDTILWNNSAPNGPEIAIRNVSNPSTLEISYSDLTGGQASVDVDLGCTLNWLTGMIDENPVFAAGSNGCGYLRQISSGQASDSPCIDAGSDLASNLGMDTFWTRTDGVIDSGTVDLGFHYGAFSSPWTAPLYPDTYIVPETTGGTINFNLNAGTDKAHRNYILLGGASGTEPGFALPGGQTTLPLNFDVFTELTVLPLINTYIFSNFMGVLDADGRATAQMNLPSVAGYAGVKTYYAYCLGWPWEFASNPVEIEIVP